jgi:hypothetical protein
VIRCGSPSGQTCAATLPPPGGTAPAIAHLVYARDPPKGVRTDRKGVRGVNAMVVCMDAM